LVTVAEQEVPSGLAGLIMAATPLWVIIWRTLARDRAPGGTLVGVAIGFLGVAVLLLPGDRPGDVALGWVMLVVIASLLWSLGTFGSSRLSLPSDLLHSTGLQMGAGGLVMIVVGLAIGEGSEFDPATFSTESILGFVYLVFIGSIVAFTAYVWLLQLVPVSKVATYAYVNPIVAVTLGSVFLDEEITTNVLIGAVIIVASVAFVVRTEGRAQAEAEAEAAPAEVEAIADNGRASPAQPASSEGTRLRR
jgi:drug/metabolite transporter (DMT)-like permease